MPRLCGRQRQAEGETSVPPFDSDGNAITAESAVRPTSRRDDSASPTSGALVETTVLIHFPARTHLRRAPLRAPRARCLKASRNQALSVVSHALQHRLRWPQSNKLCARSALIRQIRKTRVRFRLLRNRAAAHFYSPATTSLIGARCARHLTQPARRRPGSVRDACSCPPSGSAMEGVHGGAA